MTTYIIRRLIQGLFVLFIVSVLVFLVIHLLPGDPLMLYLYENALEGLSEKEVQAYRVMFGLDKPLPIQYIDWVAGIFRGDLGASITSRQPVATLIREAIPVTAHLGILSLILSSVLGILAGMVCAVRRGGLLDAMVTMLANFGISVPSFWLGILMIYGFALYLGWLPVMGYTSPLENFWLSTRQLVMPVAALSVFSLAATTRQTRSSMLEVIHQDYIRTAWAKGLGERIIVMRHTIKNCLIPVITLIGMHARSIVGGSVVIELVFNINGMGRLMVEAIFSHDYLLVQGGVLFIATIVVVANLLVDISYGWLDPRVRYG